MSRNKDEHSFWDIDRYRIIIERIENGFKSCDDFMSMIQERAELELLYANKLRRWEEKWTSALKKGYEYGSTMEALRSCIHEAGQLADLHDECRMKLLTEGGPFFCMYKWKKSHCHKTIFGGIQEIRKFEEDFSNAQSGYMKLLSKIKKAKKVYHMSVIAAHKAKMFAEKESKKEILGTETKNKLYKRAEQLARNRESAKENYLRGILMCNGKFKEKYFLKMMAQFEKCQLLEKDRLENLKLVILKLIDVLDISAISGYHDVYKTIRCKIESASVDDDIDLWNESHGGSIRPCWPVFEDLDVNQLDENKTRIGGIDKNNQWYDCFESDFEEQVTDQTWKDFVTKHAVEENRKRVSQNLALSAVQHRLLTLAYKKATQPKSSTHASISHSDTKPDDPVQMRATADGPDHQMAESPGSHIVQQHSISHWSSVNSGSFANTTSSHAGFRWSPDSRVSLHQGRSQITSKYTSNEHAQQAATRETGSDTGQKSIQRVPVQDPSKPTKSHRNLALLMSSDQTEHRVQALWNFEPGLHDELALQRGEVFSQIGPTNEDGWAFGRIGSRSGLFPAGYVRLLKHHTSELHLPET